MAERGPPRTSAATFGRLIVVWLLTLLGCECPAEDHFFYVFIGLPDSHMYLNWGDIRNYPPPAQLMVRTYEPRGFDFERVVEVRSESGAAIPTGTRRDVGDPGMTGHCSYDEVFYDLVLDRYTVILWESRLPPGFGVSGANSSRWVPFEGERALIATVAPWEPDSGVDPDSGAPDGGS